ncbi:MAG TPA: hypothetical protein VF622_12435 [Segetibacter sp.]
MMLKVAYQDYNSNIDPYWESMKQHDYRQSLPAVKRFINDNEELLRNRKPKRYKRNFGWALALLVPLFIVLSCTRVENLEPLGYTLNFSIPRNEALDLKNHTLVSAKQGWQMLSGKDAKDLNYLSLTFFAPANEKSKLDAFINEVKAIPQARNFQLTPVNTTISESLLSRISYKVFKAHIDARGLNPEELRSTIKTQLNKNGLNNIDVVIENNAEGTRMIKLLPHNESGDYSIDIKIDDGLSRTAIKEERKTKNDDEDIDLSKMSDKQIKEHIKKTTPGEVLSDDDITILRKPDHILITTRKGTDAENEFLFKIKQ